MIELLVIGYAIVWLFTEARYAVLGKPSPRMRLKLENGRYGLMDWTQDFLGDFMKDVTTKRRQLRAERDEDRAEARRYAREDRAEERAEKKKAAGSLEKAADEAIAVTKPAITEAGPVREDRTPEPSPGPDAQVIPINRPKKENDMSGTDEGMFLTTAISHCEATAAAHNNHSEAGGEDFLAGLQSSGVHGRPLALVSAAQEASANAAGAWRMAAAELKKGLTVKEAYEGATGAGHRDHVTGGE
jgi:hypothetical protein